MVESSSDSLRAAWHAVVDDDVHTWSRAAGYLWSAESLMRKCVVALPPMFAGRSPESY